MGEKKDERDPEKIRVAVAEREKAMKDVVDAAIARRVETDKILSNRAAWNKLSADKKLNILYELMGGAKE